MQPQPVDENKIGHNSGNDACNYSILQSILTNTRNIYCSIRNEKSLEVSAAYVIERTFKVLKTASYGLVRASGFDECRLQFRSEKSTDNPLKWKCIYEDSTLLWQPFRFW